MEKKRLEYLDMMKGIGIIGIVIMHSSTIPEWGVSWLSSFALPLFFLISGVMISCGKEKDRGMKEILRRKGRSLMLPFLWFSLIYILYDFVQFFTKLMNNSTSEWDAIREGILSLVTLQGSSVLWFLPALFFAESIFLFSLKKFSMTGNCLFCLILTVTSYIANGILLKQEAALAVIPGLLILVDLLRTFLRAACALPLLCTGYYLFEKCRDFWETQGKFSAGQTAGGICLFLAGIPLSFINGGFDFRTMLMGNNPVLAYMSVSLSSAGLMLICKNCKSFKPLLFFGKNSLIIMATHMDFRFLYIALTVAYWVNNYIPRLNRVFFFVNVIGIVLILEVICIIVINRFFPFLVGRKKRK